MRKHSVKADLVRNYILERVRSGEFCPGERLPAEREFSDILKMNPQTVRRGLEQLVAEGIIVKQARVGNFVNPELKFKQAVRVALCMHSEVEDLPQISLPQLHITALRQSLPEDRYQLVVFHYDNKQFERQILRSLKDQQFQGLVTMRGAELEQKHLRKLADDGIATVSLGRPGDLIVNHLHWVGVDDRAILTELVEGLLARGHQHIRIARYTHTRSLRPGYAQFENSFGLDSGITEKLRFLDIPNPGATPDLSAVEKAMMSLEPRTGLIVPDEIIAASVLRHAFRNGLSVPNDFSLISVQNYIPELHPVPLTSVDTKQVYFFLCRELGILLDRLCRGEKPSAYGQIFPFRINWTESVADYRK